MQVDFPCKLELISELQGHQDRIWHIAWNPAKALLASCSSDKSVRLYTYHPTTDPEKPQELDFSYVTSIATGHEKSIRGIAWAPSGLTLATASFDSNIGIWERGTDGEDGESEWECANLLEGHETECKSVSFSSSGTLLASCSRDKTVWVWEVQPDSEFECLGVLMEHTQDVKCVAFHPTEEILASASYDDTIKLYIDDPSEDWFCYSTLTGHTSTVWSLAWAPGGGYLASASDDLTVRVWKKFGDQRWACVLILEGHERAVYSVSWSPGKNRDSTGNGHLGWLASSGSDGTINVWELSEPESSGNRPTIPSHKLIARLPSAHDVHDVNAVAWCPREGYEDLLATAGDDGLVKVWRISAA